MGLAAAPPIVHQVPMMHRIRLAILLGLLSGCSAISGISSAGRPLDTFELRPLPAASTAARGTRHLIVETPTASGALTTDRIAVKANAYEVAYLPGVRWVNEAPALVQLLLVRSLEGTGSYALVAAQAGLADPDWHLDTDLQAFQLEVGAEDTAQVRVRLRATIISDADRRIRGARTFEHTVPAADTGVAAVVPAFDAATTAMLRDLVAWTTAQAR